MRYAAIVTIDKKVLLDYLQFEGGEIHDIRLDKDSWSPNIIEIVIEHPDLDKVEEGFQLRKITPAYRRWERGRYTKLLRVDPPRSKPFPRKPSYKQLVTKIGAKRSSG